MASAQRSYSATANRLPLNGSKPQAASDDSGVKRTKILLLGMRRSGKTSIQRVLFDNLPPKQTFYLETTMRVEKHFFDTVIPLEIWDCPENVKVNSLEAPLSEFSTIIFVIDIQDVYQQPIAKLVEVIIAAYNENPDINIEVFVHKAERLAEDDKIENFRQIDGRITDQLLDRSPDLQQVPLNFHLTSVYDHSVHEAFSRVLHRLIDSLPYLEELLNVFCANSLTSKAFLFDIRSRLYVATDGSPVDSATHNLCCDYLQMLNSFGSLYRSAVASAPRRRRAESSTPTETQTPPPTAATSSMSSPRAPSTPVPSSTPVASPTPTRSKELFYPSAATSLSPSAPGTTLTYHLVTPHLALLSLVPTGVYDARRGLVEYNVVFFREGVQEICEVEKELHTTS